MKHGTKILRLVLTVGIFVVLLTPLVTIKSVLYPFVFSKVLFLQTVIEIIFPFWVALMLLEPAARPRRSLILAGALLWGAVLIITTLTGIDPHKSFWGTDERANGVFTQLHYLVFFLMLLSVFRSRRDWQRALWFMLGIGFVLSVWGIVENLSAWTMGGTRVMAVFGNSILFAGYLLFPLFLSIYVFLETRGRIRWLALPVGAASLVALLFTQTRGAILGAIVGGTTAVCWWLAARFNTSVRSRRMAMLVLGLTLMLAFGLLLARRTEFVRRFPGINRLATISIREGSASERLVLWHVALRGFLERPFLGWGPENFDYVFDRYYDPYFLKFSIGETWSDRVHNSFLDILTMTGVVGLVAYVFLIGTILHELWRKTREDGSLGTLPLVGLLVAYLTANFFAFDSPSSALLFFFALGLIAARSQGPVSRKAEELEILKLHALRFRVLTVVAAVIFSAVLLGIQARFYSASNLALKTASVPAEALEERWLLMSRTLQTNSPHLPSIRQRFANAIFMDAGSQGPLHGADAERFLTLAIAEIKKNADTHPYDFAYWFTLGNLYTQAGISVDRKFWSEAEKAYLRAKDESPKRQALYFQLASLKLLQRDFTAAVEILKPVPDFDPRVADPYWRLGVAYAYKGEHQNALSSWRTALVGEADAQSVSYDILGIGVDSGINIKNLRYTPSVLKEIKFAATVTWEEKDFELLRILALLIIQLETQNADNFGQLAAVELELGNFTAARAAAQRVADLDQSSAAEVNAFLREIERREQNSKFKTQN